MNHHVEFLIDQSLLAGHEAQGLRLPRLPGGHAFLGNGIVYPDEPVGVPGPAAAIFPQGAAIAIPVHAFLHRVKNAPLKDAVTALRGFGDHPVHQAVGLVHGGVNLDAGLDVPGRLRDEEGGLV